MFCKISFGKTSFMFEILKRKIVLITKKINMKQIIAILFIILPIISTGMNYSIGDTLNVVAINGLTVRSEPSVDGNKITTLKNQEKVCIKDTANFKVLRDSIFGFRGNWVLIQTSENITGYVFDAFLSTLPVTKSMTEYIKKLPNNAFDYSNELPELLKSYAIENFSKTDCEFEYNNRADGESVHYMRIQKFQEGHVLIEHTIWEGTSTELKLENVRISEIFYLVHQLLGDTNEEIIKINDYNLRNPKSYRNYKSCVGELKGNGCGVELYKDSDNAYTLIFNFPCC